MLQMKTIQIRKLEWNLMGGRHCGGFYFSGLRKKRQCRFLVPLVKGEMNYGSVIVALLIAVFLW